MNLAIQSPGSGAYSETFIRSQITALKPRLQIFGCPVASETIPGGAINPKNSLRGLCEISLEMLIRKNTFGFVQVRELRRRLRKHRISTILANYGPSGVALLPAVENTNVRLVVHFHGYDAHNAQMLRDYRNDYQRLGEVSHKIIVVSKKMRESLVEIGIPENKIALLRYGIDPLVFPPKTTWSNETTFFGVGRFVDKKAPYLTLLAFAQILNDHPKSRLVLAGDGELLEATKNIALALGIQKSVDFPGVLPPDQVASQMRTAFCYVQHSIVPEVGPNTGDSEGTPVAILEALMTGIPVISTRHAGIAEVVVDGKSGYLVQERDVSAMAEAMKSLCAHPTKAEEMGRYARQDALQNYTLDKYISGLKEVLHPAE
jgi:colanic acid/amylovoran biosynthesis glycosyltransferase